MPAAARACIPVGGTEPTCSAYWKADTVFVGVVAASNRVPREPNERLDTLLIRFTVEQPYRGVDTAQIEVATTAGTECDMKIEEREKWLVYARRNSTTGRLEISARTALYSEADEDLSYISSVSRNAPESSIIGRVFDYPYTPWQGIKIEIRGNGLKYQGFTDKEGQVTVEVRPGRYVIRATFPAGAVPRITAERIPSRVKDTRTSTQVEFQVDIEAGRCEYVQFFSKPPEAKSAEH